jgi:hypothetical protein
MLYLTPILHYPARYVFLAMYLCILCVFINGVINICVSMCVYCVCIFLCIVCMLWLQPYFEELVRFMSSGPSHILVLSRAGPGPANVVQAWLDFMGPTDVEEAKRDKPHRLFFHLPRSRQAL